MSTAGLSICDLLLGNDGIISSVSSARSWNALGRGGGLAPGLRQTPAIYSLDGLTGALRHVARAATRLWVRVRARPGHSDQRPRGNSSCDLGDCVWSPSGKPCRSKTRLGCRERAHAAMAQWINGRGQPFRVWLLRIGLRVMEIERALFRSALLQVFREPAIPAFAF